MGKDKIRRFAEIAGFANVFQLEEGKAFKGNWSAGFFKNDHPLILELACGKGEYTLNLAKLYPEKNFIGIDYKGNRIWRGAKSAIDEGVNNVAFLRIQIEQISDFFAEEEVAGIWITFPDPQPQVSREKKRLTSPRFLKNYAGILRHDAFIHLKTDDAPLFAYSVEKVAELKGIIAEQIDDLYAVYPAHEVLSIKTYYEKKYLKNDKNIHYLKFKLAHGEG